MQPVAIKLNYYSADFAVMKDEEIKIAFRMLETLTTL